MIISCPSCETKFHIPDGALGALGRRVQCSGCRHEWFEFAGQGQEDGEDAQSHRTQSVKASAANDLINPTESVNAGPSLAQEVAPSSLASVRATGEHFAEESHIATPIAESANIMAWHVDQDQPQNKAALWIVVFKTAWILSILVMVCLWLVTNRSMLTGQSHWWKEIYESAGLYDHAPLKFEIVEARLGPKNSRNKSSVTVKITVRNIGKQSVLLDAMKFSFLDKDKHNIGQYVMQLRRNVAEEGTEGIEGVLDDVDSDATFMLMSMGNTMELRWLSDLVIANSY
jgi:predicted Zn finger-like uncharacterized protein